ncbi:MAG: phage major capsid protein, P2 family [Helicobacteraceae bacterium]|jgi:hypothetical protein|nr:phage major capsid protein, P2 family [Helicobacteraceae bacterium]
MAEFDEIIKAAGNMSAADFGLRGTLTPEQSHTLIDAIVDSSAFLQKVQTVKTRSLQKDLTAIDLANNILIQLAEGTRPTDTQRQKASVIGCTLNLKPAQLFGFIGNSALEDNAHNPRFQSDTFNAFAKSFANNLTNLGFVGTTDTYNAATGFTTLNEGWVSIAKTHASTIKGTYDPADNIIDRLTALAESLDPDAVADASILLSPADYQLYNRELSALNAPTYLIENNAPRILGIPLEVNKFMPTGVYLATPLKNLVLGVGLGVQRDREYSAEERGLKYIFSVYQDYEILIKKWVSVLTEEP